MSPTSTPGVDHKHKTNTNSCSDIYLIMNEIERQYWYILSYSVAIIMDRIVTLKQAVWRLTVDGFRLSRVLLGHKMYSKRRNDDRTDT